MRHQLPLQRPLPLLAIQHRLATKALSLGSGACLLMIVGEFISWVDIPAIKRTKRNGVWSEQGNMTRWDVARGGRDGVRTCYVIFDTLGIFV